MMQAPPKKNKEEKKAERKKMYHFSDFDPMYITKQI